MADTPSVVEDKAASDYDVTITEGGSGGECLIWGKEVIWGHDLRLVRKQSSQLAAEVKKKAISL